MQQWARSALAALGEARAEIDALNVFPVPDGDTGTNVYLTMESALASVDAVVDQAPSEADATGADATGADATGANAAGANAAGANAARALARGAMLGARGNSGVILSEYLRGVARVIEGLPPGREVEAGDLIRMLRTGSDLAYLAVTVPVEGTILSVARAAAEAAEAAEAASVVGVVQAAAAGAAEALLHTPEQLPALRTAGVVDAGGRALVVILEALVGMLTGTTPTIRMTRLPMPADPGLDGDHPYAGPAYEVMYLLEAPAKAIPELKGALADLGDSLLVVGDDGLWNVHVHVDDVGAAVEAGMAAGRPYRIRVTALDSAGAMRRRPERALVAVVHGPGIEALVREQGVHVVRAQPGHRPSTSEILGAISAAEAHEVIVLPSDKDTQPVAEVAARQARAEGIRVAVIPTRAVVQTLAAIAVHQDASSFDDDAVAMTRAAGATRHAGITVASRRALTSVGTCEIGDALGVVDGDIAQIGAAVDQVARRVLDAMLAAGGELVTLVWGTDADGTLVNGLVDWLAIGHPTVEVVAVDGGQPHWPLIIGVE